MNREQWFAAILVPDAAKEATMPKDWRLTNGELWGDTRHIPTHNYICGFCGAYVSSEIGLTTPSHYGNIYLCPQCNGPTFLSAEHRQWPGARLGGNVAGLSKEVETIYNEARDCLSVGAYTAGVMACRKILMNIAVDKGAKQGLEFAAYVDWLRAEDWAPKGSETLLKYVKDRGNEANHQIVAKKQDEAERVLRLTELLLRNMFEFASLVPPEPASQSETGNNAP